MVIIETLDTFIKTTKDALELKRALAVELERELKFRSFLKRFGQ